MPNMDFWEYILNPGFIIMFGLSASMFLPLLWSVWRTWQDNEHKEVALKEQVRAERRARLAARRARRRAAIARQQQSTS